MSFKFEIGKDAIIEAVVSKIMSRVDDFNSKQCAEFVRQYYNTVAIDDLREWDIDDLYGAAINLWSLLQKRSPKETKIRIYNPDFERHGWQTTHTVVEIVCRDVPFLVDSIRMVINRLGLSSHLIIHIGGLRVERDESHQLVKVLPRDAKLDKNVFVESPIFVEIDRQTDPYALQELHANFERVLGDNFVVVEDWEKMREQVRSATEELDKLKSSLDSADVEETIAFLRWLEDHHFTFLGVRDYELVDNKGDKILRAIPGSGLGVLRDKLNKSHTRNISNMTPEARELTLSSRVLVTSKTNTKSSVHRDAYTDYIGVKRFDKKGKVIGERRIIGLYTSAAYHTNPKHIPFLRHKVATIMANSKLNPTSHSGKVLLNILETLPRDDLIQGTEDELLEIAMGIFHMQERRRIRMFARVDVYRRFISCLVFVPKDRFNTELRYAMQEVLHDAFDAKEVSFSTRFSESVLARIHFIVKIDSDNAVDYDFRAVEQKLIEVGRSWSDDLQEQLIEAYGEEQANRLFCEYKMAFPAVYSSSFSPRTAVFDISHVEKLSDNNPLEMNFYRPLGEAENHFRLKIYRHNVTIPLSDVLPIIENLGLRAISERPYVLKFKDGQVTWINEFSLQYNREICFELDEIKELFQTAFTRVWFNDAENDGFNQLVLAAGLNWRQVTMLRAYAKYFKQIGFTFSQEYIESSLNQHPSLAKKLVQLFESYFEPTLAEDRQKNTEEKVSGLLTALDEVSNLDEDKIIRHYIQAITSTLRTNYYQKTKDGRSKNYLSLKLNGKTIPGMPRPYPMYEIFVYSPRMEGVHLRCGKVARGGLRWSDRKEDFRTEVLGLMKAQQVKNAVIVPSGAKGGFVPKQLPSCGSREEIQAEAIECYRLFIRGLLDITDNYQNQEVCKPDNVVCYDGDDPYLVVAADKGTATFSDLANEISLEYNFWLGDAFASGGSVGYDHKKMGITAKGAWESVKRHFYQLDIDINETDFTVVGIGDMSGDVFGNGMLLSKHIKLVAAFNHLHIFVDPSPDPEVSFKERERLFGLPRSSWTDYNQELISKGGGVFYRNAKSIAITKEMRQCFGIKQTSLEPNALIMAIMRAKVDLLWSGGIGTFVKAISETSADVGDRTNDAIRINAEELHCKVVAEGGNLGLTQLARLEYAKNGGLIYTDFIDNSAGVSCSDKEVNIKILLNQVVENGDLTYKQRNKLLSGMQDEVAKLVLRENYLQTRAISFTAEQALRSVELHGRYISELERLGKIDRDLEFLPDDKIMAEHKTQGKGLGTPGIAVLLCYSKILLKEEILASDVPEDPYLEYFLVHYFPKALQERFSKVMQSHRLKREIIATSVSNLVINEMGFTFIYRLQDETGAPVSAIVRAYMVARGILHMDTIVNQLENLSLKISAQIQTEILMIFVRLLRRVTRWFLRNQRKRLDISQTIDLFKDGVTEIKNSLPRILGDGANKTQYDNHMNEYASMGLSKSLAHELTVTRALFAAPDIIEVAQQTGFKIAKIAEAYFAIGEFLDLNWIRTQVIAHTTENHWEALSREALRDDLDWQQRQLSAGILRYNGKQKDILKCLDDWSNEHGRLIQRWRGILENLRAAAGSLNYTMLFVAVRELLDLTQTTEQV